jgi:hypothetical protein
MVFLHCSDTAGQLHIYAAGPVSESLRRAPYDQFLSSDYSPLMRDLTQWVGRAWQLARFNYFLLVNSPCTTA